MTSMLSCGKKRSCKSGILGGGQRHYRHRAERYGDDDSDQGGHVDQGCEGEVGAVVPGVTGVILAGGASSRMGSNKALLPRQGLRFIEWIYRTMAGMFNEVVVVTNSPEQYKFLPCRKAADVYQGKGVLGGIHSGLVHSSNEAIFVVACDMPYLNERLIRHLCTLPDQADLVIPSTEKGFEPLHALYRKACLPALEELLQDEGNRRVVSLLSKVNARKLQSAEIAVFDPDFVSFTNINTPEEYFRLRSERQPSSEPLTTHTSSPSPSGRGSG